MEDFLKGIFRVFFKGFHAAVSEAFLQDISEGIPGGTSALEDFMKESPEKNLNKSLEEISAGTTKNTFGKFMADSDEDSNIIPEFLEFKNEFQKKKLKKILRENVRVSFFKQFKNFRSNPWQIFKIISGIISEKFRGGFLRDSMDKLVR